MTYCTLFSLLTILAFFFGVYFAYSTTREEDKKFDITEFLKILGLFVLCGLVFGIFVDILFLAARFSLWVIMHLSGFLKTQLLARKTGAILSLLAINAMGGYLFWEMRKEGQEREETDFSVADTSPPEAPEDPKDTEGDAPAETPEASDTQAVGDAKEEEPTDSETEEKRADQPE